MIEEFDGSFLIRAFLILEPSFDKALFVDLWFFPLFYQFLFVAIIKLFYTDKKYYKPIDKKTNYVKRAVGIAGDTLEVINGYVYINGKKNQLPEEVPLQIQPAQVHQQHPDSPKLQPFRYSLLLWRLRSSYSLIYQITPHVTPEYRQ